MILRRALILFFVMLLVACSANMPVPHPTATTEPSATLAVAPSQTPSPIFSTTATAVQPVNANQTPSALLDATVPRTSSPVPIAAITGLPKVTPTPMPHVTVAPPGSPVLYDITFIDPLNAYATTLRYDKNGAVSPGSFRLLSSKDGGKTWQTIRLPGDVQASIRFVLDVDHLWLQGAIAMPPNPDAVKTSIFYRTSDGGRTWQKSTAPFAYGNIRMFDAMNGWADTTYAECGAGTCLLRLYRTSDGGQTWNLYQPTSLLDSIPGLPDGVIAVRNTKGFTFPATDMIWEGGGLSDYGANDLIVSRDQGHTWRRLVLDLSESLQVVYIRLPVFINQNDGFLSVTIGSDTYAENQTLVFASIDGGRTWSPRIMLPFGYWMQEIQFVNENDWFAACHGALCRTHDGVRTWTAMPLNPEIGPYGFHFLDARNGWGTVYKRTQYGEYQDLYLTHDGGQTWAKINPKIK